MMDLLISTGLIWAGLHLGTRWFAKSQSSDAPLALPLARSQRSSSRSSRMTTGGSVHRRTQITIRDVRLTVVTTRLNAVMESLAWHLSRRSSGQLVRRLYDIGAVFSAICTAASPILLALLAWFMFLHILSDAPETGARSQIRFKRDSPPLQRIIEPRDEYVKLLVSGHPR